MSSPGSSRRMRRAIPRRSNPLPYRFAAATASASSSVYRKLVFKLRRSKVIVVQAGVPFDLLAFRACFLAEELVTRQITAIALDDAAQQLPMRFGKLPDE